MPFPRSGDSVESTLHQTTRKSVPPLELRIKSYDRAKLLRTRGMSYSEISETLKREYGYGPSKGQLSGWLREIHGPLGSSNRFVAEPSPELAYVIGVKLGDGSINRKGYNRRIRLQSIDLDFVLEFDRCLSKVLGTRRHKPWFDRKRKEIHVEARSVLLFNFLQQSLEDFNTWIEHCPKCVSMFLRGFLDSEGSVSKEGSVTAYNSDTSLLGYVQQLLLSYFNIETTGPRLQTRAVTKIRSRGHVYLRRNNIYLIYVRAKSLDTFRKAVGFAIERKRVRLNARPERG